MLLKWLKKREPKNAAPPHVYKFGGGWGDALNFDNVRTGRCHGFKRRIAKVGDLATYETTSGKMVVCQFTEVEPCGDPVDMFFGTVDIIDYTDTAAGKKALEGAQPAPSGMHPDAHRWWEPPLVDD